MCAMNGDKYLILIYRIKNDGQKEISWLDKLLIMFSWFYNFNKKLRGFIKKDAMYLLRMKLNKDRYFTHKDNL